MKLLDCANLAKRRHLDHQPRGISIRRIHVQNFGTFRLLVVWSDRRLGFKSLSHATAVMGKGPRYVAQQNHIARTTRSISSELIRLKYAALIIPMMMYAASILFQSISCKPNGKLRGSIELARRRPAHSDSQRSKSQQPCQQQQGTFWTGGSEKTGGAASGEMRKQHACGLW